MGKFDFSDTLKKIQRSYSKDLRRMGQFGLGNTLENVGSDPSNFVVLPEWWKHYFGVIGLPFGKTVQISGKSDGGKTSLALLALRCAQEQGYGILYCETEGKTSPEDLAQAGIDPKGVIAVRTNVTEEVFDGIRNATEAFFDDYPTEKLLVVIDSYGNTTSMKDSEIDLTAVNQQPGAHAKSNRTGLMQIRHRQDKFPIATLLVNYAYKNFGTHGSTDAGGEALKLLSMLVIRAARTKWLEKTVKGEKYRVGVEVKWTTEKNHFAKALKAEDGSPLILPKEALLQITGDGIQRRKKS